MASDSYLTGWLIYMVAVVGFLALGWYSTRNWSRWPRQLIRATVATLVLMPWQVSPTEQEWAPAWLTTLFDGLLKSEVSVWRAGLPLLIAVLVAALVASLEQWYRTRRYL